MQVYRHCQGGYWRASKRWCKKLPQDAVSKALIRFASNEAGLCPACVYGGPDGAIEQLKRLEKWFQVYTLADRLCQAESSWKVKIHLCTSTLSWGNNMCGQIYLPSITCIRIGPGSKPNLGCSVAIRLPKIAFPSGYETRNKKPLHKTGFCLGSVGLLSPIH